MKRIFVGAALGLCLAATASAGVVYDNGSPHFDVGGEITGWIQADDFIVAADTAVNRVRFWSFSLMPGCEAADLSYAVYSDSVGEPGSLVVGWNSELDVSRSCVSGDGGMSELCENVLNIQPFTALAGTTYWLALHNNEDLGPGWPGHFVWARTDYTDTDMSASRIPQSGGGWIHTNSGFAFQLENVAASTVPEPGAALLAGLGIALVAGIRRFRA